ncbi:response regulator transcription factor [Streptomyces sp. NPDC047000]|uniref:response regulator transcription factor n=1 Tax=Streptomyces sp. NPDC047000 TaxID=3155474 RepID=UPI0033E2AF87
MPTFPTGTGPGAGPGTAPGTGALRVAVLARRPLLVTALRALLTQEPGLRPAGEAASWPQLRRLLDTAAPRVVLIDDSDPGWDTADVLRALGSGPRRTAAIVLVGEGGRTGSGGPGGRTVDAGALEYLWAGADGFVLQDAALSEIAAAIRAVAAGHAVLPPPLTRRLVDLLVRRVPPQPDPPRVSTLTSREREIFDLVAAGMSNGEVAEALVLSEKTVKFHVSNLLRKLGVRNRAQAIVCAWDQQVLAGRRGGPF